jgi:crossover junction endodeoxyribonuclease RuvC
MRVLGIDPGYNNMGLTVIEQVKGKMNIILVTEMNFQKEKTRYLKIGQELEEVIDKYKPNIVIIERTLIRNNAKTSLLLSQARGVILFICEKKNLKYLELSNNTIKKYYMGKGRCSKKQIKEKIIEDFGIVLKQNAADSLMIALVYYKYIQSEEDSNK